MVPLFGVLLSPKPNEPWSLHGEERCWQVTAGAINIYLVPLLEKGIWGRRRHLLQILPGNSIIGLPTAEANPSYILIAQSCPGTHCQFLNQVHCQQIRQSSKTFPVWQALVSNWLTGLGEALFAHSRPRESHYLVSGIDQNLSAGLILYAAPHTLLWVTLSAGVGHWTDAVPMVSERYYPITSSLWLQSTENSRISSFLTNELTLEDLHQALIMFSEMVMQVLCEQAQKRDIAETERQLRVTQEGQLIFSHALTKLGSILTTNSQSLHPVNVASTDHFFMAFSAVLAATGLKAKTLPSSITIDVSAPNYLEKLVRASRVNFRRVSLQERNWWQHEIGPILSFWKDSQQPIAIIPKKHQWGRTVYCVLDPQTNQLVTLDKAIAEKISIIGFMFFGTFSTKAVNFKELLELGLRQSAGDWLVILSTGIIGGLLGILPAVITGELVSNVIPTGETSQLLELTLILIILALTGAIFSLSSAIAFMRVETQFGLAVNAAIIDRLLSLPTSFFRQYTAGDLTSRVFGIDSIMQMLTGAITHAFMSGIFSLFSFGYLFFLDIKLAMVALLITVIATIIIVGINLRRLHYVRDVVQREGDITGEVFQLLTGLTKLRVAAVEKSAFARWADKFSEQNKSDFCLRSLMNQLAVFNSTLPIFASMALFAMMAFGSVTLNTGTFISFNSAFGEFLMAGIGMGTALTSVLSVIPLFERIKPILETYPEIDDIKPDALELTGAIELSSITFRYNTGLPPVLNNLSLSIKPGEFLALVGPSGSGKSTLLRLLLGFDQPESGAVYYDEMDLAGLDVRSVRQQIGVVLQNGKLIPGSLFTNIVGSAQHTLDDAMQAARMAGMEEDLKAMPMGLHTMVAEGASTFSGGQRQRLMIARALVKKPRLLIFDEATSALDNRTQALVSQSIQALNATRIVIAHRLSTIRHADRIVVLENGGISECGTYEELMSINGRFAELAKRQLT